MKNQLTVFIALCTLLCLNIFIGVNGYWINSISISKFYFDQADQKYSDAGKVDLKILYRQNAEDHEEEAVISKGSENNTVTKCTKIQSIKYYGIN